MLLVIGSKNLSSTNM
nr:RecName: Full=Glutathione S-transferase [Pseudomonas sp. M1]